MTRRNKLQKFADLLILPNVYENFDFETDLLTIAPGKEVRMKGRWAQDHFKNDNPIILELACGRGEYSLALAEQYPDKNFIGLDIKGARLWKGANIAQDKNLDNVAFLRTRIEMITNFFEKDEVSEIWITFPDPFLKDSKSNRRLTAPNFLAKYKEIIKTDGLLHLKTDDDTLYEFSQEELGNCPFLEVEYDNNDIYSSLLAYPELEYKTYYEAMHLKKKKQIKYIRCTFKA